MVDALVCAASDGTLVAATSKNSITDTTPECSFHHALLHVRLHAFFHCGVLAGDVTLADGSRQAMLAEPAGGLTATVEARDDLAIHILHLAFGIDPETGTRIMDDRRGPGRVERSFGYLVLGLWLAEVFVFPRIHE